MIFDYKIAPVLNKITDASKNKKVSRKVKNDKRKQKRDRRSSVRDGVVVSLSFRSERRKGTDRRKAQVRF